MDRRTFLASAASASIAPTGIIAAAEQSPRPLEIVVKGMSRSDLVTPATLNKLFDEIQGIAHENAGREIKVVFDG